MTVVRSVREQVVIAGPGAGKTELLAQRAAYLLQTGVSPRRNGFSRSASNATLCRTLVRACANAAIANTQAGSIR